MAIDFPTACLFTEAARAVAVCPIGFRISDGADICGYARGGVPDQGGEKLPGDADKRERRHRAVRILRVAPSLSSTWQSSSSDPSRAMAFSGGEPA
jgi:hypothetical protein